MISPYYMAYSKKQSPTSLFKLLTQPITHTLSLSLTPSLPLRQRLGLTKGACTLFVVVLFFFFVGASWDRASTRRGLFKLKNLRGKHANLCHKHNEFNVPGAVRDRPETVQDNSKNVCRKKKKMKINCERAKDQKLEAEPNLWPGSDNRIDDSICRPHDTTEKTRNGNFFENENEKKRKKNNGRHFFFLSWKLGAAFVPDKNYIRNYWTCFERATNLPEQERREKGKWCLP